MNLSKYTLELRRIHQTHKIFDFDYDFYTNDETIKYNFEDNHKLFAKANKIIYSSNLRDLRKHIGLVFQFPEYQLF